MAREMAAHEWRFYFEQIIKKHGNVMCLPEQSDYGGYSDIHFVWEEQISDKRCSYIGILHIGEKEA